MNFQEILAKFGSATIKTLGDARSALAEVMAGLTAAAAQVTELEARAVAAETKLAEESAKCVQAAADLIAANGKVTDLSNDLATVTSGTISALAGAGIVVEKLDADTIKAAAKTRAEAMGHELLAARGIKPLPVQVSEDANATGKPATDAEILAAYEAMPAGQARLDFLSKNQEAIWRAHSK